ncbi:hypothetical protein [Massilia sp. Root418]|uniref:glycine-rich domain-containing protein n=1 Tax=Massilia sp. Root418 TaxID=1736532 RepID=UPI000AF60DE9|nr:hypothetical protein [Massilia sp. Root418]
MSVFIYIACASLAGVSALLWRRQAKLKREAHIRSFVLPKGLFEKLMQQHPHLTTKECQLVAQGLRQFFLAHLKSGRKFVSMPSQVVDDLWHEFILYTKNYHQFCQRAFGRFLHHTPAIVMGTARQDNGGLKRCWHFACLEENINPAKPSRLPLLFALDAKLAIPNGFVYTPNCSGFQRQDDSGATVYCGADLGCSDGGGSDGGSGSDAGCDSDGGSGGGDGGCGGGGCGGGGD